VKALSQLECPQSFIHGWAGLALAPHVYALFEVTPFAVPPNPGPTVVYTLFAMLAAMKMIDDAFVCDWNYFKLLKTIHRACFCMLDELVPSQFKVSNTPTLTGWNSTMSIHEILTQLEDRYGKPSNGALFATDNCFKSAFGANKASELLFYRVEQCQEIMTLGKMPYMPEQIINNALRLLMALNIFPMNEFDEWETQTVQTYPALKTFIHEAYTRRLNAMEICNTSGQMGYAAQPAQHNMYNVLDDDDATKDSAKAIMVATITAAAMTGSTLGSTYAASNTHSGLSLAISAMIPPAFNQIAMNQTAFANQLAAMLMMQQPQQAATIAPTQFSTPPVPNVAFPMQHPFPAPCPKQAPYQQQYRPPNQGYHNGQQGYFGDGRGRQSGGCGRVCGSSHGGCPHCPNFQQMQGGGTGPFAPPNLGRDTGPFGAQPQFQNTPNPIKRYANWNACFSWGFDGEDGHTSATCPTFLRKHNHQVKYMRDNAAAYAVYEPSTKGRHKTQLPNM
jgi:hypothetical protein